MRNLDRFILYPLFLAALAVIGFLTWQLFEYATALPTWETALAQSRAELSETRDSLRAANQEISALDQKVAGLRREVAQLTAAQESTAQQLEIYRSTLEKANANIRQANDTINGQTQQLRAARDELIATRNERNAALFDLDVERRNLAAEKQITQRQAGTITRLEGDIRSKDSRITQLNSQTTRQGEQIARNNTLIRQLRTQISQQTTTISSLRSSLRTAQNQQIKIPTCSTNYFTVSGGQLSCVARSSTAFQATQVESRDIDLPQTGRVTLKINRSGELGSDQSMELLEHAVRTIEEYMGQPIPLQGREVRLDFVDELKVVGGDFAGTNNWTHMEILKKYDSGQSWQRDALGGIIAHEVAHYYWTNERTWLHEGAADFLELYSENRRIGTPIRAKNRPCYQVANISQLESRRYETSDAGFRCNYSLGEGLFVDLYDALPADQFRQSFVELYESGENKIAGIHQVREAYPGNGSIIDKWYGYREKPEAHWPNGEFLGYMTWQESGEWVLTTRNGRPCATTLELDDQSDRGYSVRQTRHECYYTGVWSDEGHLLVTISGTTYRAVDIEISRRPRYEQSGAVPSGGFSPALTAMPLRGGVWNS